MEPVNQAEDALWSRFLKGDQEAFTLLYTTHVQDLFSYGSCLVADREVVKDCIQEVFIKIHTNRNHLKEVNNARYYLCTSLKNALYNHSRHSVEYTELSGVESFLSDPTNSEEELIEKETKLEQRSLAGQMFKALSPRQQKAIYYRFVEDLSYQEIGQMMDMNFQSAQNLVQRSLRKIRTLFASLFFFF